MDCYQGLGPSCRRRSASGLTEAKKPAVAVYFQIVRASIEPVSARAENLYNQAGSS